MSGTCSGRPRLLSAAIAVPPYEAAQAEVRRVAERVFDGKLPGMRRLLPVFANSGVERRYFAVPPEWFLGPRAAEETNRIFIESAVELSAQALVKALGRADLEPADVATPSIDARLINRLDLRDDIRRTPIWGRGCAGGVAGLAHVCDYLEGKPDKIAALVAAEFCGLTFIPDDYSKSNFVACALFGDGVGAAVLGGAGARGKGAEIVATRSRLFRDSLEVMGWNLTARGLQVVFQKRIPEIVRREGAAELDALLAGAGVSRAEIDWYLYHPGGRKVLDAYIEAFGAAPGKFDFSRQTLRDYGNMSSATVLFVLERFLREPRGSGWAAVGALGPGFSSESLLLKF